MGTKRSFEVFLIILISAAMAFAQKSTDNPDPHDCSKLPDYSKLKTALTEAVKQGKEANGGLGNQEWAPS